MAISSPTFNSKHGILIKHIFELVSAIDSPFSLTVHSHCKFPNVDDDADPSKSILSLLHDVEKY